MLHPKKINELIPKMMTSLKPVNHQLQKKGDTQTLNVWYNLDLS